MALSEIGEARRDEADVRTNLAGVRGCLSRCHGEREAGRASALTAAMSGRLGRRTLLRVVAGAGLLALPAPASVPAAFPPPGGPQQLGYAFGTAHQDVTVFDPATLRPLVRQRIGSTVRWLDNEQTYWDGRFVWSYDFPGEAMLVEAVAFDPRVLAVPRIIPTGGRGPAHSLMLGPDLATAWVNLAGDDTIAVLDLSRGEVTDRIRTGAFP